MYCETGPSGANRRMSGCQYHPCTQPGTCGTQRYVDQGGKIGKRGQYGSGGPSCDEFLPDDFYQTDGTPPQALRCTTLSDNESGGQVFKQACQAWPYPTKFEMGFKDPSKAPMCSGQCRNSDEIFFWGGQSMSDYYTYSSGAFKRDNDPTIERRYRLSNDEVISVFKKESEPNEVGVGSEAVELQVNGTGPAYAIVEIVAEVKADMFTA